MVFGLFLKIFEEASLGLLTLEETELMIDDSLLAATTYYFRTHEDCVVVLLLILAAGIGEDVETE